MRIAFILKVKPDAHEEYERRHRPIWPELESTIKAHGGRSYSIFLDPETSLLFGYAEIEDRGRWDAIADTEVCRRWWNYMADIMEVNPDRSPWSKPLQEVFHIE